MVKRFSIILAAATVCTAMARPASADIQPAETIARLSNEQLSEINRLLLLLVPHNKEVVDVPSVRRHLLRLAEMGLAQKDEYATCVLYLRNGQYLIRVKSTERVLTIRSNHPDVPDTQLWADFYRRDAAHLPEALEELLLNSDYYRP